LESLGLALAQGLQVACERGEAEEDFVADSLLEQRGFEMEPAAGVNIQAEVVAFALLGRQDETRGGRECKRAAVVLDLEQARRAETGAVARAILDPVAPREV